MEWISVVERLPSEDAWYLVTVQTAAGPRLLTAWFNPADGWSLVLNVWINAISHWMAMPAPAMEEQAPEPDVTVE